MKSEESGEPREQSGGEVDELADILMVLQRKFLMNLSKELSRGQVSFAQFFLLGYLLQHGTYTMSQIAGRMGHTTAAATGLVDRLQNLGYVERGDDARDRRKVLVKITAKGRGLVAGIREDMVGNLRQIMGKLTDDEQRYWLRIYRKIHEHCTSTK